MKATGIVRRIDDLGRVVVPKEIRRTLRIREGDPLEIFTDREGEIILKKYSPIGELSQFAREYADALGQVTGHIIAITDKDQFIAVAGGARKELLGKTISHELEQLLEEREVVVASRADESFVRISEELEDVHGEVLAPILSEGDLIGSVLILAREGSEKISDTEKKLAMTAASFLGRQMEN